MLCAGGLTGFNVAKDLMKLDFSTPEEAPEEFKAVMFSMPPAKKGLRMPSLTALEIQTQGAFVTMSPPAHTTARPLTQARSHVPA